MKSVRWLVLAAAILLMGGCAASLPEPVATPAATPIPQETPTVTPVSEVTPAPQEQTLFALGEYPLVDGSTASLPLGALVLSRTTGISLEDAQASTIFHTTPNAYERLLSGDCDLLLVYEPAEETKQMIETSGVELEFYPIGIDALVFIVNENNPVNDLSEQQLVDVYSGKIKSWDEIGGEKLPIIAYPRSATSGSQALFLKLLMKETPPMAAPATRIMSDMGGLIEELASYNNTGEALGYSVYYYAKSMYAKPGLKFLAVDSVAPSNDTLKDESYPFCHEFYAVIRKDAAPDSNARKLLAWILSPDGKQTVEDAGYVAVN